MQDLLHKEKVKDDMKKFWTYLVIMGVAVVCAFNYEIFVFPNKFAPSGLNGICTMIQYLSGVSIGYLSLLINIPLAFMVYKCISKPLAIRSMVYVVTFSLSLLILDKLDLSALAYSTDTGTSTILGPLVAGIIYGGCYSVLVRARRLLRRHGLRGRHDPQVSPGAEPVLAHLRHQQHRGLRLLLCIWLSSGAGDPLHSL